MKLIETIRNKKYSRCDNDSIYIHIHTRTHIFIIPYISYDNALPDRFSISSMQFWYKKKVLIIFISVCCSIEQMVNLPNMYEPT